ncbi:hypothetical protein [Kitasatospora sp. NPDC056731]|uniref:hypothetical protein n=1 Tax=Kitasatospora sp. NPDC056731 TaxID=3155422 RepID=UPI0034131D56
MATTPGGNPPIYTPFFGVMGATSEMVFSALGDAYGSAKTAVDAAKATAQAQTPAEYAQKARATAQAAAEHAAQAQQAAQAAAEHADKAEAAARNLPTA